MRIAALSIVAAAAALYARPGATGGAGRSHAVGDVTAFAWQAGGNNSCSGAFLTNASPTLPKSQTMAVTYVSDEVSTIQVPRGGWRVDAEAAAGGQLIASDHIVRRLTPLECERLQGFPDGWTDVPGTSDSQRYKEMGNSVAVPVFEWVLGGIANYHAAHATEAVA